MERHCCEDMRREVERVGVEHADRLDCPDGLLHYFPRFRAYGLIVGPRRGTKRVPPRPEGDTHLVPP